MDVKGVKLMYFLKKILYFGIWFGQTKCKVMMTKEGSTKIVNFMNSGAGVLVLGCDHISHILKMYYFFKNLLLYSQAYIRQKCLELKTLDTGQGLPKLQIV